MSASDFLERIDNAEWAYKKGDIATPSKTFAGVSSNKLNKYSLHVAVQSLVIIYYLICSFTYFVFYGLAI